MKNNTLRGFVALLILTILTAGCAQQATPASQQAPVATPLPAIDIKTRNGAIRASGNVEPAQKADLSFPAAGRVQQVAVDVGDQVEAGAVLMTLDDAAARAAVMQAEAALARAQAQLAELQAGPRPQEIAVAEAQLESVQARLSQLTEGARTDEVKAAEAELTAAKAALQQLFSGPKESDRIAAQAALSNAEAALQQAQAAYDPVSWRSDVGKLPESRQLQEATNNYEAAQARYNALFAGPDADVTAAARARVQQAQAALDRLTAPATTGQTADAEAQVRSAQAQLDLLKAGARPESITVAKAAVSEAEAALLLAQSNLANTELRTPFAGTVTARQVNLGEMVLPGQVVLTLADLSRLTAHTTDLSERDVARVAEGMAATVYVESLDMEVPGRVSRIAPQANVIGGDVVYGVEIDLDSQPASLRWGMSVDVDVDAE